MSRARTGIEEVGDWTCSHAHGPFLSDYSWFSRCRLRQRQAVAPPASRGGRSKSWRSRLSSISIGRFAACICGSTARLPNSSTPCCWIERSIGCTTSRAADGRGGITIELGGLCLAGRFAELSARRAGHCHQAVSRTCGVFPAREGSEAREGRAGEGVRATFGVPPGIDSARPSAISPWPNLFLAGDWTYRPAGLQRWRARREAGTSGGGGCLRGHGRTARHSESGFKAARIDEAGRLMKFLLPSHSPNNPRTKTCPREPRHGEWLGHEAFRWG
jgi:hypothetical protein